MLIGDFLSGRVSLSQVSVDPADDDFAGKMLERLRNFGVTFSPGWLDAVKLADLQNEFEGAFADSEGKPLEELTAAGKDLSRSYGRTRTGRHLKYSNGDELTDSLPVVHEVFNQAWMGELASDYLGLPCTLNRHVILTDDHIPGDEIIPYHYDEMGALKFFIYLDPIDKENGPFQAIPETRDATRQLRISEWLKHDDIEKVRIKVFESFSEDVFYALYGQFKLALQSRSITFQAPAGSLLVFDTDTIHRAGLLSPGRRRRVVRGSSYRGLWP
ncbi:hypothetical protein P3T36_005244 [Kitasatospora sp. MAP12-15]|uniref:phytanoyl-CoA dioxygenase family protein n=1 Tax=unclassified Kitasatospora TaxID=2633591 RepID=UPI002475DC52|nr:phytanoyl-CoA dioxygenase family protein [Kitasatospora sp. MAP12-44]MDH6113593.1 hypothetical protein [Kitasatospora sp. MAP12-44]